MQPIISDQQGRINLNEIKLQILKQVGPDRTREYFRSLTKFLSHQLTKSAFDKFCLLVLGRENIPLHNHLIRSILKNAYTAKTPPPVREKFVLNQTGASENTSLPGNKPISLSQPTTPPVREKFVLNQTGASTNTSLHVNKPLSPSQPTTPVSPNQINGDILPSCPRKKRTGKSPLGSNGRVDEAKPADISIKENGVAGPSGLKTPMQHVQSGSARKTPKRPRGAISLFRDHICELRKRQLEAAEREERKRIKIKELNSIQTPIGVSYGPSSVGGKRRSFPSAVAANRDNGELYNSEDLKSSMERVAEAQGIKVTLGCADLLNRALNAHLKRIIKSGVALARGRSMHKPTKDPVLKQQINGRPLNGIWVGNHMNLQNGLESMNVNNVHRNHCMISLQDFQAAMELNPQQLGRNWPSLLERISLHSFKE